MKRFNPLSGTATSVAAPAAPAAKRKSAPAPTGDLSRALALAWAYTDHTGYLWRLIGPSNKGRRAEILRALTGRRIPVKDCGITVLEDLLYTAASITGTTPAERARHFAAYLAAHMGAPSPADSAPPATLSNAPAAAPAAPVAFTPATTLGAAAFRVPLATYRALLAGLADADAEAHRIGFAGWCDRHAESFTDWRAAHLAYLHPRKAIDESDLRDYPPEDAAPEPSKIIPFPADSLETALARIAAL